MNRRVRTKSPLKRKRGKIFILSGPSGSGKTTLHKKLLLSRRLKGKLVKSVSVTTRPKRSGEQQGCDYLFISKKNFLYKKRAGHLLESERVFDNYYGTPKKQVRALLGKGKSVLLCIDVKGAKTVCRKHPDAVTIFITVPSEKELKRRLKKRGSEDKKTLRLRLSIAKKEIRQARHYRYVIVNKDLQRTYKKLEDIVYNELSE